MGARKKISAEKRKEALKTMYFAKLQNVPTSPDRKSTRLNSSHRT